jgi:hypothetical protein
MAKFTGEVAKVLEPQVIFIENFIQQLKKNWMEWIQQEPQVVDMEVAKNFLRNQAAQASLETDVFPHVDSTGLDQGDLPWFHFSQHFPWNGETTFDKLNHAKHEAMNVCIAAYFGDMDQDLGGFILFEHMIWLNLDLSSTGLHVVGVMVDDDNLNDMFCDKPHTVSDTFQIREVIPDLFE